MLKVDPAKVITKIQFQTNFEISLFLGLAKETLTALNFYAKI